MSDDLVAFLNRADLGHPDHRREVEARLAGIWDNLDGSDDERTTADKLIGRTEGLVWEPPVLRFHIERHGATALGSSFADIHYWSVDLVKNQARIELVGRRLVAPRAARLDIEPLVQRVVEAVVLGTPDPWVKRLADGRCHVRVGMVIPDRGPHQTVASRRRRFRGRLLDHLNPYGWAAITWPTLDRVGGEHA